MPIAPAASQDKSFAAPVATQGDDWVVPQETPHMGSWEAGARLYGHHLGMGFADNLIGKESIEQARQEHPYINYATMPLAAATQAVALAPIAGALRGAQGAKLLGEAAGPYLGGAARALETFLPNTKAATLGQAGRTGAKVGAAYSGAETLGTDVTDPNKTWAQTAGDVGTAISPKMLHPTRLAICPKMLHPTGPAICPKIIHPTGPALCPIM